MVKLTTFTNNPYFQVATILGLLTYAVNPGAVWAAALGSKDLLVNLAEGAYGSYLTWIPEGLVGWSSFTNLITFSVFGVPTGVLAALGLGFTKARSVVIKARKRFVALSASYKLAIGVASTMGVMTAFVFMYRRQIRIKLDQLRGQRKESKEPTKYEHYIASLTAILTLITTGMSLMTSFAPPTGVARFLSESARNVSQVGRAFAPFFTKDNSVVRANVLHKLDAYRTISNKWFRLGLGAARDELVQALDTAAAAQDALALKVFETAKAWAVRIGEWQTLSVEEKKEQLALAALAVFKSHAPPVDDPAVAVAFDSKSDAIKAEAGGDEDDGAGIAPRIEDVESLLDKDEELDPKASDPLGAVKALKDPESWFRSKLLEKLKSVFPEKAAPYIDTAGRVAEEYGLSLAVFSLFLFVWYVILYQEDRIVNIYNSTGQTVNTWFKKLFGEPELPIVYVREGRPIVCMRDGRRTSSVPSGSFYVVFVGDDTSVKYLVKPASEARHHLRAKAGARPITRARKAHLLDKWYSGQMTAEELQEFEELYHMVLVDDAYDTDFDYSDDDDDDGDIDWQPRYENDEAKRPTLKHKRQPRPESDLLDHIRASNERMENMMTVMTEALVTVRSLADAVLERNKTKDAKKGTPEAAVANAFTAKSGFYSMNHVIEVQVRDAPDREWRPYGSAFLAQGGPNGTPRLVSAHHVFTRDDTTDLRDPTNVQFKLPRSVLTHALSSRVVYGNFVEKDVIVFHFDTKSPTWAKDEKFLQNFVTHQILLDKTAVPDQACVVSPVTVDGVSDVNYSYGNVVRTADLPMHRAKHELVEVEYSVSTAPGFSGSPVLCAQGTNSTDRTFKVWGIHKRAGDAGRTNVCTTISSQALSGKAK